MRFSRSMTRSPAVSAQAGFSLIEIIIVVTIIALIAAFVANKVFGGSDRAKVKLAQAQVQTLAEKIQQYEMDTGSLPGSLGDLVKAPGGAGGWLGPYAKDAELNDPWNQPYTYTMPGNNVPFDLVSLGADRKPGGDSVNADIHHQ